MPVEDSLIYFDHHATTPCDPRVVEAMGPFFTSQFANAGSVTHRAGQAAHDLVEERRATVARLLNVNRPGEIVFTSGATESNQLAIAGACSRFGGGHVLTVATEHPSVLVPFGQLKRIGFEVEFLPVVQAGSPDAGRVELERLCEAIRPETRLVSVMLANNEIGAIQPLREISARCVEKGIILHCDATQAVGKLAVDVQQLNVDLLSFSAHKFYGPKGVGALFVRGSDRRIRIKPQVTGGGQEGGRRGGTLNVPGIVGLTRALELAVEVMAEESVRIAALRNRLWNRLQAAIPDIVLNGPDLAQPDQRLAGNLNLQLPGCDGHSLMVQTPELAMSSGSACTATSSEPSHVLLALGLSADQVRSSLRIGLGRFNTETEIERAAELIASSYRRLRRFAG
jgi:cysteine desulfurase